MLEKMKKKNVDKFQKTKSIDYMHVTFRKFETLEYVLRAYDMKLDQYGRV